MIKTRPNDDTKFFVWSFGLFINDQWLSPVV